MIMKSCGFVCNGDHRVDQEQSSEDKRNTELYPSVGESSCSEGPALGVSELCNRRALRMWLATWELNRPYKEANHWTICMRHA